MDLAQIAADIVVGREDTAVCSAQNLRRATQAQILLTGANDLHTAVAEHRARGKRIVFTNGCFDVLHADHIASLRHASHEGDVFGALRCGFVGSAVQGLSYLDDTRTEEQESLEFIDGSPGPEVISRTARGTGA